MIYPHKKGQMASFTASTLLRVFDPSVRREPPMLAALLVDTATFKVSKRFSNIFYLIRGAAMQPLAIGVVERRHGHAIVAAVVVNVIICRKRSMALCAPRAMHVAAKAALGTFAVCAVRGSSTLAAVCTSARAAHIVVAFDVQRKLGATAHAPRSVHFTATAALRTKVLAARGGLGAVAIYATAIPAKIFTAFN